MTFEEVLDIKNGKNQKAVENPDGKYPIYGSGGIMGYADKYICEANTVIIGRKGSINNPIYVETPFWNVDTAFGLVAKSEKLIPKYLYYFCKYFDFEKLNTTVTIPSLTKANLLKIKINIPEVTQQSKEVEVLDKVNQVIELRKIQLENLNNLIKSRFVEMFGDSRTNSKGFKTIKLQQLGNVGSSKRVFVEQLVNVGIPFYRGTEIGSLASGDDIMPDLFITEEHYELLKMATGIPKMGDLLMPSICPDGRIWRVNTDEPFYFKDGRVLWININSQAVNSVYLQYALKDKFLNDYSNIASGTTFAELKIFALKDVDILLPEIGLQTQFATFVQQVDKLKVEAQKSLDEMQVLFDSLMQKYFG